MSRDGERARAAGRGRGRAGPARAVGGRISHGDIPRDLHREGDQAAPPPPPSPPPPPRVAPARGPGSGRRGGAVPEARGAAPAVARAARYYGMRRGNGAGRVILNKRGGGIGAGAAAAAAAAGSGTGARRHRREASPAQEEERLPAR